MQLLNIIYGAGVTSKLFLNVREKLSLCYYCGSSDNGQKGFMTVHSGIEFKNEKTATDEILAQLEEIKKGNIAFRLRQVEDRPLTVTVHNPSPRGQLNQIICYKNVEVRDTLKDPSCGRPTFGICLTSPPMHVIRAASPV